MSAVDSSRGETDKPSQESLRLKRSKNERRDRSFVRPKLGRRAQAEDMGEKQSTSRNARPAEKAAHPVVSPDRSSTGTAFAGKEPGLRSEAIARRYIQENFEPEDWLAVVVRNRHSEETVQRITTARQIASPEFQSWLRHKNAQGSDIYLSLNTLRAHSNGRTKADLKDIRHLYLDLDEDGQRRLATIYEDAAVPHPNYVLQTSPRKYQVVWRVEGIAQKHAEDLLRGLARRFGGDSAATDATRVFRLPGFSNKKYHQNFSVKLAAGTLPAPIYHQSDFRIAAVSVEPGTLARPNVSVATLASSESAKTQSEKDWAYAVRRLRRGDNPEDIVRDIAAYRATNRYYSQDTTRLVSSRKPNPRYYAEHTVSRAMMHLGMTKSPSTNESSLPEIEPDR